MDKQKREDKKTVIDHIFDERKQYLIIALTGKIGAGCSYVSSFIRDICSSRDISRPTPGLDGFSSDEERANSILLRYYNCNRVPFHIIRARDVITSFIVEDDAWERLRDGTQSVDDIKTKIMRDFHKKLGHLSSTIDPPPKQNDVSENGKKPDEKDQVERSSPLKSLSDSLQENENRLTDLNKKLKDRVSANSSDEEKRDLHNYILYILPLLADCIREYLSERYTFLFQQFGNDLRFYGTLKTDAEKRHSSPQNDKLYTIAERINRMIKHIRAGALEDTRTAIVIDSMKNKYESNYLRDRYSAYYLFAVSRDETIRIHHLLQDPEKRLTQDQIDINDLNERPEAAAGKFDSFVDTLNNVIKQKCNSNAEENASELKQEFFTYVSSLSGESYNDFYTKYCVPFRMYHPDQDKNPAQKMLEAFRKDDSSIRSIVFEQDKQVSSSFREQGISAALCRYYLTVLQDPLRAFLYKTKLYPFFLQDVEYCIQNADVFLTNNEDDAGPKHQLKMNIIRYLSLMMHPGLVPPTPIERCMQLAYTAKVNSGCISRQTGAVVTDSQYNIISLGWNDVPYGQTPCVYRNLLDLQRQNDKNAFSDYEWENDSPFQNNLKNTIFRMLLR